MSEAIKKNLILVEDNDDHAELAEFYINEYEPSIQVERLFDGKQALDYFDSIGMNHKQLPWLVLLDLKLPKHDGHEILKKIKTDEQLINIPVVIFSTSNSNKDIESALNLYANSYIVKPMEADGYESVISELLNYWSMNQHHLIQGFSDES